MNVGLSFLMTVAGIFVITMISIVGSIVIVIDAISPEYDVPWPLFGILSAIVTLYARILINRRKKEKDNDPSSQEDEESD